MNTAVDLAKGLDAEEQTRFNSEIKKFSILLPLVNFVSCNPTEGAIRKKTGLRLIPRPLVSNWNISQAVLNHGVSEGRLKQETVEVVRACMMERIAMDFEYLAVNGDASLLKKIPTVKEDQRPIFSLLSRCDGWFKLAKGPHINCRGKKISLSVFRMMIKKFPGFNKAVKSGGLRFVASEEVAIEYNKVDGIPVIAVPSLSADFRIAKQIRRGGIIWLVDPKNLVFVLGNKTKVFTELLKDVDQLRTTGYNQVAVGIKNPKKIVTATNFSV